ncbi:MAG: NUDIX domain-containing protein [Gemmatimonadales bacterium]
MSAGGVVIRRAVGEPLRYLLIKDSYGHWGLPKGHVEARESAEQAALRETEEETGLGELKSQGPITTIDWYFRLRGKLIHKYCHFFLIESAAGDPVPQLDEGITECRWLGLEDALERVDYANAREVLRRAGEQAQALVS